MFWLAFRDGEAFTAVFFWGGRSLRCGGCCGGIGVCLGAF